MHNTHVHTCTLTHTYTHAHTHTHAHSHTHMHTHAHAHMHTHTQDSLRRRDMEFCSKNISGYVEENDTATDEEDIPDDPNLKPAFKVRETLTLT